MENNYTPTLPELLRVAKYLKLGNSFKCTLQDQEYELKLVKKKAPDPVHIKADRPERYW